MACRPGSRRGGPGCRGAGRRRACCSSAASSWPRPTILLAFIALVTATGCFIECSDPEPGNAVVPALGVLVTLALPFAAVRFYQGAASEAAARRRLAVVAVIVLLVALVEAKLLFG